MAHREHSCVVCPGEVPLLLTAHFVGSVLVPITNEVQLTREDVHSVANKQILWMEVLILSSP